MLQILDIKKSFGELHVLRGVDLDVEQGDVVAIIGPSGSGKTTLLRCINFLEKADSGTLIFDNEKFEFDKITKKEIARLRRKTAFVFHAALRWPEAACCHCPRHCDKPGDYLLRRADERA